MRGGQAIACSCSESESSRIERSDLSGAESTHLRGGEIHDLPTFERADLAGEKRGHLAGTQHVELTLAINRRHVHGRDLGSGPGLDLSGCILVSGHIWAKVEDLKLGQRAGQKQAAVPRGF